VPIGGASQIEGARKLEQPAASTRSAGALVGGPRCLQEATATVTARAHAQKAIDGHRSIRMTAGPEKSDPRSGVLRKL
jgi:hypothetical protein